MAKLQIIHKKLTKCFRRQFSNDAVFDAQFPDVEQIEAIRYLPRNLIKTQSRLVNILESNPINDFR